MPFTGNGWNQATLVPYGRMRAIIERRHRLVPVDGEPSAVAREFSVAGLAGTVGFITSMTDDFCATCSRLRLTADGCVRPCLHDPAEVSLLEPLRSGAGDEELAALIRAVLRRKPEKHAPAEQLIQVTSRAMIQIGG
jgi:cyclic pyranopterin phosphate synthase